MSLSLADIEAELEKLAGLDPALAARKRKEREAAAQAERAERAAARKTPPERTPMSEREQYAARVLGGVTVSFLPGEYNKRFARDLAAEAQSEDPQITERQRATLWRLVYRYRRQIGDKELVAEARKAAETAL